MSNNKQSSVQWVVGKLSDLESMFNLGIINNIQYYEEKTKLVQQAKAMHKEEIIEAWSNGYDEDDRATSSPLKYYNETFK